MEKKNINNVWGNSGGRGRGGGNPLNSYAGLAVGALLNLITDTSSRSRGKGSRYDADSGNELRRLHEKIDSLACRVEKMAVELETYRKENGKINYDEQQGQ
ncbi:MAG: hypothetical protein ACLFQV_12525 [Vulcanimicrobiota bacterium]